MSASIAYISFPLIYTYLLENNFFNLAFGITAIINITASFCLQRIYVFRSKEPWLQQYVRFWLSGILVIIFSYIGMRAMLFAFKLEVFIANAIVVTLSAIASYLLHSNLTFRKRHGYKDQ